MWEQAGCSPCWLVRINVLREKNDEPFLDILFQGRESQCFRARHYHHDAFTWPLSERRARQKQSKEKEHIK